jgi:hypothetical protein
LSARPFTTLRTLFRRKLLRRPSLCAHLCSSAEIVNNNFNNSRRWQLFELLSLDLPSLLRAHTTPFVLAAVLDRLCAQLSRRQPLLACRHRGSMQQCEPAAARRLKKVAASAKLALSIVVLVAASLIRHALALQAVVRVTSHFTFPSSAIASHVVMP